MKKYILLLFWFSGFAQFNPVQWYLMGSKKTLKTNLVGYFKLDGNVVDQVNGNNGSDIGAVSYVTGKINQGSSYVSNSYSQVPNSSLYNMSFAGQDLKFSINCWLSLDGTAGDSYLVNKRSVAVVEYTATCNVSGSDAVFTFILSSTPNSIRIVSDPVAFTSGAFNMLTFTYDGSETDSGLKIYFNGTLLTTTPTTIGTYTGIATTTDPLFIGNDRANFSNRYVKGVIDEIAIYKGRELTTTDINQLYNSGSGLSYPF